MSNRLAIDPSEIKISDPRAIHSRLMNGRIAPHKSPPLWAGVYNFAPEKQTVNHDIVAPMSEGATTVPDIRSFYKLAFQSIQCFKAKKTKADSILQRIADLYDISVADLCGPGRVNHVVLARQHAMYALAVERPELSIAAIGRILNRDHTTAIYSVRRYIALHGLAPLVRP